MKIDVASISRSGNLILMGAAKEKRFGIFWIENGSQYKFGGLPTEFFTAGEAEKFIVEKLDEEIFEAKEIK